MTRPFAKIRPAVWAVVSILCVFGLAGCSVFGPGNPPVGIVSPAATQPAGETTAPQIPEATATAPTTPTPAPTATIAFTPQAVTAGDCSYGGAFQSIEALDLYTIRFAFCEPEPAFLSKAAFPNFSIYPQEWLARITSASELDAPVGSGPYRLGEWVRGERLTLQAFDGYRDPEKPALKELSIRWELDASLRLVELQAGTADGIDNVSAGDYEAVRSEASQALLIRPALSVAYLGMNNLHPPFDDDRVRRAIALGIDKERLLSEAFPAGYEPAAYFAPCAIPGGCTGEPFGSYDPEAARALLAEAGFPNGFETELFYRDLVRGYLPWPAAAVESLKDQLWENLRINARARATEDEAFYAALDSGGLNGLYLLGWGADYPDMDNFLRPHFGVDASLQFGNPFEDLAAAIQQAGSAADPQARLTAYAAANTLLRQHVPMVPLAYGGWITPNERALAVSSQVQGAHASPFGLEDFATMSISGKETFMWIQESEPLTLFCPFAEEIESLHTCAQIAETLYRFVPDGAAVQPGLAESCTPDDSLTVWTCTLRPGVQFHDGTLLDANDVMASFAVQWDAASRLHSLEAGEFVYFEHFWPGLLNEASR